MERLGNKEDDFKFEDLNIVVLMNSVKDMTLGFFKQNPKLQLKLEVCQSAPILFKGNDFFIKQSLSNLVHNSVIFCD